MKILSLQRIAAICHEANRTYCVALNDYTQPTWNDAPKWQRASAINGVRFHLNNPNASESASHEQWLDQKRREGWQYGPTKDPEKKLHPCFVPFSALPEEQQAKDRLFKAIVDALRHLVDEPLPAASPGAAVLDD